MSSPRVLQLSHASSNTAFLGTRPRRVSAHGGKDTLGRALEATMLQQEAPREEERERYKEIGRRGMCSYMSEKEVPAPLSPTAISRGSCCICPSPCPMYVCRAESWHAAEPSQSEAQLDISLDMPVSRSRVLYSAAMYHHVPSRVHVPTYSICSTRPVLLCS